MPLVAMVWIQRVSLFRRVIKSEDEAVNGLYLQVV